RFLDESKLCQQLSHPNIIKHLGAGKLPDGRVFMATELLEGEDLASRIRNEGPLTPGELVRVILPICEALDYVHQRQVIHRDVKPANVFLSGGLVAYDPKLIDFGLALFQGNKSVKTAMGVIVATPEYTPPECINGQKADARSDLYALGVLMFEALTGAPPFVASSYPELLLKHLNEPPPELPEHAQFLAPIVSRCLAKNPTDRFPTAGALAQALRECTSGAVGSTHVSSGVRTSGIRFGDESPLMGSYQPIKLIGEGAMGRVYLARHTKLGRQVALKVLRSEHAHNPQLVQRFIQEAQTVNQINHEHIVEIFDFIETGSERDRRVAFVMELLTGASLTDVLRAEPMPVVRAVGLVRQVCSALEAAHKVGVVHRDVKPDNIFITQRSGVRDFVKMLDFGVAKLVRPLSDSPTVGTMEGVIIGTPTYMAPEQASGKPADARVDIYALGVVLYEMLVGAPPFDGEVFGQLVVKIVTEPPPRIPDQTPSGEPIPQGLKALIMRCLAKTPGGRPQTMTELAEALRPFESGDAVAAAPTRTWGWMVVGLAFALGLG
ncbi:MAG TPA: serine/threonine-protein kinase, partial [Myxococcaceae bacterium]|nr:serine/threonine-protein kinase [Myxococcaceae bacterium]